jgi:SOS-response transcriptional repressor LexA
LVTLFAQSGFVAERKKRELPEPVRRIRAVMASRALEVRDLYRQVQHRLPASVTEEVFRNKLNGRTQLDAETLALLSNHLGLAPVDDRVYEPRVLYGRALGNLRILGGVAAGLGWDSSADEDSLPVPISLTGPSRVGWIVRGDSMMPFLQEGDVAIFEEARVPKLHVPNLIRTGENEHRVKMVRHDGTHYRLWSLNPVYKEEMATGEWLGYLVGYYRLIGSREAMEHDPSGLRPDSSLFENLPRNSA